jgi:glutaredoxin
MTDCSKHYMEEDDVCPYCERDAALLANNELIEKMAKLAESEPWPEGPAPAEVLATSASLTYEQIVEATVKATRESIAKKIRAFQMDPQQNCDHQWSHIEDHHVYCHKCKKTADLCWTCETEKTKTADGRLVCLKCNPQ